MCYDYYSLYCSLLDDVSDEEETLQEALSKSLMEYNQEIESR